MLVPVVNQFAIGAAGGGGAYVPATYVSSGSQTGGAASDASVAWPTHQANDVGLLVVESDGTEAEPTLATANGFERLTSVVCATGLTPTRLTLFWKRATSTSDAAPTVEGTALDHFTGQIYLFRGCVETGNPFAHMRWAIDDSGGTTVTFPAGTSVNDGDLVVGLVARGYDPTSGSTWLSTPSAAELDSETVATSYQRADGNGGGWGMITATDLAAGDFASFTATSDQASCFATLTMAVLGVGTATPTFTPLDLGADLLRWFDFSDETSISDTAGLVDQVDDLSGYAVTALTSTSTDRPTTSATTLNSLNVLDFAGDYLGGNKADWKFLHDGTEFWCSIIVKIGAVADPATEYGLWGTNLLASTQVGAAWSWDDTGGDNETLKHFVNRASFSTNVNHQSANGACSPNAWHTLTLHSDVGNATAADRSGMYVDDGTVIANNASTASPPGTADPGYEFRLAGVGANQKPLTGSMAEVVFYTADRRSEVEAYLTAKWGL